MRNRLLGLFAAVIVLGVAVSTAEARGMGTVFGGDGGWEAAAGPGTVASLTWAGETETWTWTAALPLSAPPAVELDDRAVNPDLVAGLPAPEPPAILLAGMALGSVLFGRSFLSRRPKVGAEDDARESEG